MFLKDVSRKKNVNEFPNDVIGLSSLDMHSLFRLITLSDFLET